VKAKNGVITLTGSVDSYYEKARAEDITSRANGVLNVKNNLAVSYPPWSTTILAKTPTGPTRLLLLLGCVSSAILLHMALHERCGGEG